MVLHKLLPTDVETDGGRKSSSSNTNGELSQDTIFKILNSPRRRQAVELIVEAEPDSITINTLSESIAAREYDKDPKELTDTEERRVYVSLYQSHLPTLEKHDLIEIDDNDQTITTKPTISTLEPYLQLANETTPNNEQEHDVVSLTRGQLVSLVVLFITYSLAIALASRVHSILITVGTLLTAGILFKLSRAT